MKQQKTLVTKNPNVYLREDLTREQIITLFQSSPLQLMENKKIRIPKSSILDFLSQSISVDATIKLLNRPETGAFYNQAVELFVLGYQFNFNKQCNGQCPKFVIDLQFVKALEKLACSGIKMDFELMRKAFFQIDSDACQAPNACHLLMTVSRQLGEEIPEDLYEKIK